jgi:undecaprenyl-diphosphatase
MDLIALLKAIVLGIVEGVTEFIPVSSTGHLILTQDLIGFTGLKENAFIIFIQLGAILAVVWLYRMKFIHVLRSLHREPRSRNLVVNLIAATLPAVVIGLPTEKWIEAHLFRPVPVALAFILGGLAIILIERRKRKPTVAGVDDIPLKKALGIGCIQVLALLFPGVSRSGATIMGGLVSGLSRTAATEFSFFLAIPAMMGASLIKLLKVRDLLSAADLPVFAVGFAVSFLAALVVIRGLLAYVSRRSFLPFAGYRIFFGVLILALYWNRGF